MSSWKYSLPRRIVPIAGVWFAVDAVEAVRNMEHGRVRVHLSSGAEVDLHGITAEQVIETMKERL